MHKEALIQAIADKIGARETNCNLYLDAFPEIVKEVLSKGESLQLIDVGTLSVSETKER